MPEPIPINALYPCCRTQTLRLVSVSRAECSSGAEGCPVIFDADLLERAATCCGTSGRSRRIRSCRSRGTMRRC